MSIEAVETLFWVSVMVFAGSGATYCTLLVREHKPRWKRVLEALAREPQVAS